MSYGPWIKHNGNPVPHLAGKPLLVRLVHAGGDVEVCPCSVTRGRGGSWIWRKGYSRVIEYCIKEPRGLATLRHIASLPHGVDAGEKERLI